MGTVWVHDDAIGRDHPVFERAGEGARAVFVFDGAYYEARGYTLKRLVFIMECVEDAGFEMVEGDLLETLRALEGPLLTARTPNPHYREVIESLRQTHDVTVVRETAFAQVGDGTDLKRFFRYWKKAKKSVMQRG